MHETISSGPGTRAGSERQACVLVVDDDQALRRMTQNYLQDNGMRALATSGRQEMVRQFAAAAIDLVILDLRLGQDDGLDLLRELRARSDVPVIVVTGHRRDDVDRVVGLELGAHDYVTKPFNLRELLARVRAVLRRFDHRRTVRSATSERGRFRFLEWHLDRKTRRPTDPAGAAVPLTRGECALLLALLEAPQRRLSREYLLQVTRRDEDVFDRSIDVQVLRLRRKLERDPSAPQVIQTERGVGYVFAAAVERL
jgi:DNA-binding response OmpR family regulator